jgi:hypothetical protein
MTGTGKQQSDDSGQTGAFGYCAWHQGNSRGVRLIQVEEAGSGPGTFGSRYACHSCRQAYDLVPFADRPL